MIARLFIGYFGELMGAGNRSSFLRFRRRVLSALASGERLMENPRFG